MDQDVKEQWLDALRSGKYPKGRGALRDKHEDGFRYCCLGVLCDLYPGGGWRGQCTFEDEAGGVSTTVLPPGVREWAGCAPGPKIDGTLLSSYNDGTTVDEHSFEEIADLIEAYL